MITVKICQNNEGYVTSVVSQGHAKEDVCAAVSALMQSCGHQLEMMKSAKIDIDEKGIYLIQDIRRNKPALAVTQTLVEGVSAIARQNKFSVQVMWIQNKEA